MNDAAQPASGGARQHTELVEARERPALADAKAFFSRPQHLYVHVPFCSRRCSYCDFAITVRRTVPVDEFLDALARELVLRYPADGRWEVETIYLGGGTPSRLGERGVARLLELLGRHANPRADAEITLEANPEDISIPAVRAWRHAGINRLSIGIQSFHAPSLAWMHRTHTAERAEEAIDAARAAGMDNVSVDLIYALPCALGRDWTVDLERTLRLAPDHISVYGLTVEPRTPLGRWTERGTVTEAPEEQYEQEYLEAHDRLTTAGYQHYEVSSFARPGRRARHNSAYWTRSAYAGIGPSAHELTDGARRWNAAAYGTWLRLLDAGADPVDGGGRETLSAENRLAEEVYLGLRSDRGLKVTASEAARAQPWIDAGWAKLDIHGVLRLTAPGWLRLDALATDLTALRSRY